MSIQLRIVTPTGEALDTSVDRATATGLLGEFGVLPGHIPMITALKTGPLTTLNKGLVEHYALGGGFVEINDDTMTFFVESAESAKDIDAARAQKALDRANKALLGLDSDDPNHAVYTKAKLRAANRIKVANLPS